MTSYFACQTQQVYFETAFASKLIKDRNFCLYWPANKLIRNNDLA